MSRQVAPDSGRPLRLFGVLSGRRDEPVNGEAELATYGYHRVHALIRRRRWEQGGPVAARAPKPTLR